MFNVLDNEVVFNGPNDHSNFFVLILCNENEMFFITFLLIESFKLLSQMSII